MKATLDSCQKLQYLAVHCILQTFGLNHFRNWKWLNPYVCKKKTVEQKPCWKHYHLPWRGISALDDITKRWFPKLLFTFGKVNNKSFLVIGEIHFVRLWEVGTRYFQWTTRWRRILQSVKHANSPTVDEERSSCLCSRRATIHRARSNLCNKNHNNTTQLHVLVQMIYHTHQSDWIYTCSLTISFLFFFFFTARGRQR